MNAEETKSAEEYYKNEILKNVDTICGMGIEFLASTIDDACHSIGRDEFHDDSNKISIILSLTTLMYNLAALYDNNKDYGHYKKQQ
jgi:hypothetical protein